MSKAAFILNYKTLRKTEVFVGYEVDDEGQPMLKSPKWEPITEEILSAATDNNLLCRTVKYENKAFGCHEAIGMRLPVYNKYFIIGGTGSSANNIAKTQYVDKLAKAFNKILKQHQNVRVEYLSTGTVSSKQITPSAQAKAAVAKKVDLTKNIKAS